MPVPDELKELHDEFQLQTKADALVLVAAIAKRSSPGDVSVIYLDDDRRIVEFITIAGGGEELLSDLVYVTCSPEEEWVTGLLLVTDRTGRVPMDEPDDELIWQELVDNAAGGGVRLFDWFVVADGRWAYSLPQFAPTRPQWSYGRVMDWVRFASLADDWPHAYQAFDCSLLDPADEDERRIGLTAAHPELHDLLDEDDAPHDDNEMNPHLHLAGHEIVANQLIDGEPAEARETAERLLDEGFDAHTVLHMLASVVMDEVRVALLEGAPIDPNALVNGYAALPDSWFDLAPEPTPLDDDYAPEFRRERERIEAAVIDLSPTDAAALLDHLGLADHADPHKLALYLHWHEDYAHVLPDERVVHETQALDGLVLLHRVSPAERAVQRLLVDDLEPLLVIPERRGGLPLASGGVATIVIREALDGSPLGAFDDAVGVFTLNGPDGWLGTGRESGMVALEWRDGAINVRPAEVDEDAVEAAAGALAAAFDAHINGPAEFSFMDNGTIEVSELILDVLVTRPDVMRRPTAPIFDIVLEAGLSNRGAFVAAADHDWDAQERLRKAANFVSAIEEAGVERADEPLTHRLIERIESWLDGEPSTPRDLTSAGEDLLVPGVATAVFNAHARFSPLPIVEALLHVTERVVESLSGRADGGARFLAAYCADRLGDGVLADAHVRAALAGGLDDYELFDMAADYMLFSGDLARAAHLLSLAGVKPEELDLDVAALLAPFTVRAERNDMCPCGSGHKYKRCHGQPSGPHRTPIERAELVHLKAGVALNRVSRASTMGTLRGLGWSYEDDREPTPLALRVALDLTLFEGGVLERIRKSWGPLFPADEQRIIEGWVGVPIGVAEGIVTRALTVDDTQWLPWELALGSVDPDQLRARLADADHLRSAESLAPLLAKPTGHTW